MDATALSPAARDRFARNGFVVLEDAVPADLVDEAFDAVAATVPEDLSDPAELIDGPEDRHYWNDLEEMAPFEPLNERLFAYASDLVGEGALRFPGEFVQAAVRYPTGATPADPDRPTTAADGNAHLDVVSDPGEFRPFAVAATAYLDDVRPCAGGLTVWPGSHRCVAEWFRANGTDEFTNDGIVTDVLDDPTQPFEVAAPAGSVILWHSLLVHTGGVNLGRRPRVATFTRFRRREGGTDVGDAVRRPFDDWDGIDE